MIAIIGFITLIGASIRLLFPLSAVAPLNDGGLFYAMTRDLQENKFVIPLYTSYNSDFIPFAYPPLAFYFTGLLAHISGWSVLDLLRILSPIFSVLTIPAFYLLSKEMLGSKPQTVIAVLVFAFIPSTFDWHIMGGGVTRSPGFIFAILAIREFYLVHNTRENTHLPGAILFSTLSVYTHPEAPVHIALSAITFYMLLDRSIKGLGRSILIASSTLILTFPWWGTIVSHHGVSVFLAPLSATSQDSLGFGSRVFSLVGFQFTDELFLNLAAVLGLLGVAVTLARKQYMFVLWLAIIFLIEPRGGRLYIMLPHAMMAAIAVEKLILPGLKNNFFKFETGQVIEKKNMNWADNLLEGTMTKLVLGYIFLYGIMSAFTVTNVINSKYTLRPLDIQAFGWVKENTSLNSRFVLLTNEAALRDSSSDWFPALAERKSLVTVFGSEWINDNKFSRRTEAYTLLQDCSNQDETCLSKWSELTGQLFDYVYIRKYKEGAPVDLPLIRHLIISNNYELVYNTDGVAIFRLNQ